MAYKNVIIVITGVETKDVIDATRRYFKLLGFDQVMEIFTAENLTHVFKNLDSHRDTLFVTFVPLEEIEEPYSTYLKIIQDIRGCVYYIGG